MARVEFGVFPTPVAEERDRIVEQVLSAERLGLDLIGIQDHPYQRRFLDTWSLIPYLAGRTDRVRFFPDVGNLPLRPPAVMAKAAASLDRLSGGRFGPGARAGAGWVGGGGRGGGGGGGRGGGRAAGGGGAPERGAARGGAIDVIRRVWAA